MARGVSSTQWDGRVQSVRTSWRHWLADSEVEQPPSVAADRGADNLVRGRFARFTFGIA
jgi:hypothetical protein